MPGKAKTPEAKRNQVAHLNKPKPDAAKPGHTLMLRPRQIRKIKAIKKNDCLLKKAIATLPPEYREGIQTFGDFTRAWVDSLPDNEES